VFPVCFNDLDRDAVKQGSKDSAREANQRDDSNRFRRTWGAGKTKVINARFRTSRARHAPCPVVDSGRETAQMAIGKAVLYHRPG
jgi:hypothetical protein